MLTDDPLLILAERLQGWCLGRGITVATAESCTGGLLAHLLTEIPGSVPGRQCSPRHLG